MAEVAMSTFNILTKVQVFRALIIANSQSPAIKDIKGTTDCVHLWL